MNKKTLSQWLVHLETAHSKGLIDMGLERITQVKNAMNLTPNCPVITVGGTNGKGSTCAFLSQIYTEAGYTVGTLTSPHLLTFNERIAINCQPVSDETIIAAFERIEAARGNISLTYFEFNTLAAVDIFRLHDVDVMILEVGLGGRLDAVNIFDTDCAITTSVDLDHQAFLGNTIEQVAHEKAGIFRANKPAICGQNPLPQSLVQHAQKIGAKLLTVQQDFVYQDQRTQWQYQFSGSLKTLSKPTLQGDYQLNNAACTLTAIECLRDQLPVSEAAINAGLQNARNIGRFQIMQQKPLVIMDVGHNPHAARALKRSLKTHAVSGKSCAVFSILADKDSDSVLEILRDEFDEWYIAPLHLQRGMTQAELANKLVTHQIQNVHAFDSVQAAYQAAFSESEENDRIVVFGSFHTVSETITLFKQGVAA